MPNTTVVTIAGIASPRNESRKPRSALSFPVFNSLFRQPAITLSCMIFILGAGSALGQTAADLGSASLQDLLNTKVYSASRHEQRSSDAPSAVTVVTAEEIQKYGYRTLADILRSVRGFYITYDHDYSYVGVRGFGRLGDWNSRVLVMIDGHRINDNVLGQAMIGTEFLLDVDLIERVEIIRGPNSSLYGTDAFFAVINVITRQPENRKGLELAFAPASFGTYQGRATYSARYQQLGFLLSGTFYDSQGETLFYPQFDSRATNYGITSNTDYENSQHLLGELTFRGFTLQGVFSARDRGVPIAYFDTVFNDPRTHNNDYHQYLDLKYEHSLRHQWELEARTAYDQARLQAPLALSEGPGNPVDINTYSFRGNWWSGEAKLMRTFFTKHRITFGSEFQDNLRQSQGDYDSASQSFAAVPGSSFHWASYMQDEFAISHKLSLNAGVRYDRYSTFGGTTNPRLALVYHVLEPTTLKLLYGTAFRAPQIFEQTPGYGPFYENNLALSPETIRSVEGVVEQALGQHLKVSGSVFHNRIDNLISLETDTSNNAAVYRNSPGATANGAETELEARFQNGWQVRGSYSYANTEALLTGQSVSNSPAHLGKLNLSMPFWEQKIFGGLEAQYTSARSTLAGNTVGGFAVLNGTLLAHTFHKQLDFSASMYNLLNKRYFDPGRPEDVQDAIEQDGRTFRVKLTWRIGE